MSAIGNVLMNHPTETLVLGLAIVAFAIVLFAIDHPAPASFACGVGVALCGVGILVQIIFTTT